MAGTKISELTVTTITGDIVLPVYKPGQVVTDKLGITISNLQDFLSLSGIDTTDFMRKSVYDTNNNSIADSVDEVNDGYF